MSTNSTHTPAKSASRWWRLDPLVAAHLRSESRPAATAGAEGQAAARVKLWSAEPDPWADTAWSDTRVDFYLD